MLYIHYIDDIKRHIREASDLRKSLEENQLKLDYITHKLKIEHTEKTQKLVDNYNKILDQEKLRYNEMKLDLDRKIVVLNSRLESEHIAHIKVGRWVRIMTLLYMYTLFILFIPPHINMTPYKPYTPYHVYDIPSYHVRIP